MADKSVRVILTATVAGFMAEVRKAQGAVKDLAGDLSKASQTQEWKRAATNIGVVGLALTAVAGLAIAAWANFDQQMSKVAATGQDAKQNIDGLRQVAIQAGIDTKYSATEAAAGIESLLKAGVSAADILGGGLNGALSLAASGNLNVADSAEVAATAMTQFGLKGTDVGHIADLLAAGAGKAQGEVSDLSMALKQGGLVASQAGLSLDETVGTLTAFASAGLIGSDAGTSFRSMLLRLMNPTKEASGLMAQYGINTYDTNGKFVTMTDLAGQLQTKLGGLSEAQRNNALAVIFGQDAIRGANVLYKQGAQGIADWTAAVNDEGFAADVAKTKMDNLQGSFKLLTSSIETLGINAGSSAGGALRSLVDQLNSLVQVGIRHTDAAQGILAMVLALGGFALVTAGVMKTVTAVAEFRAGLAALALAAPKVSAAISSVSLATKGAMAAGLGTWIFSVVAAFTVAAAAAQLLSNKAEMPGAIAGKAALLGLATGASNAGANMDKMFQDATGGFGSTALTNNVNSLASALTKVANKSIYDDFRDGIFKMAGAKGQVELVTDQFTRLDEAMTQLDVTSARAAFAKVAATTVHYDPTWTEGARDEAISVEKLIQLFPEYKAQLQKTATALGVTNLTNQEYVDWMGGKIPPAIQAAAGAAKDGTVATDGLNSAMSAQELQAKGAAQAEADLADALRKSADAALAATGSAISYQAAIDDAAASVAKNGVTLDINTEQGRNNRTALDDIAASALRMTAANAATGASNETLTAQMGGARAAFIAQAVAMGMDATEADTLANTYGLIPGTVTTNVTTNAAAVTLTVEGLRAKIAELPAWKQAIINAAWNDGGMVAGKAMYDAFKNKEVSVTTTYKTVNSAGSSRPAVAGGGLIAGPGTGTSDSIPAWLSNGEYIINAAATARNLSLLNAINYGGARIPGFAGGGPVAAAPASYSTSTAVSVGSPNVGVTVLLDGRELDHRSRVVFGEESGKLKRARDRGGR